MNMHKTGLVGLIALGLAMCPAAGSQSTQSLGSNSQGEVVARSKSTGENVPARHVDGIPIIVDPAPKLRSAAKVEILRGDGEFIGNKPSAPVRSTRTGSITLDFADADLKDVVRTILGDILKAPFTVDPKVSGKVNLKSIRPLTETDVIATLETVLRANDAAMVKSGEAYAIVPLADAQKRSENPLNARTDRALLPGYGVDVVPLRFVAASELQKVLSNIVGQGTLLGIDTSRNLIFIQGTAPERAATLSAVDMFDVDYLKAMSFAFYRPQNSSPTTLAAELRTVIERPNSPSLGLVQLIPLDRTGMLIVVSSREAHLQSAVKWAEKLDVPSVGPARQFYYYRLQDAKVQDIAPTLAAIWGGGPGARRTSASGPATDQRAGATLPNATSGPAVEAIQSAPSIGDYANGIGDTERSGPQLIPDEANNAVIIRANKVEYEAIVRFLREIDVTPAQVLIEATIAEVSLNDKLRYGVEWFFRSGNSTFNQSRSGRVSSQFPGFSYTYLIPDVEVALNALGTVTHVNVVSTPKIMTLDNRSATLQVGDQVPIITQSAVAIGEVSRPTVVNSVQFRDTGIVLTVTPRIGKGGTVYVDINQEVSDAVPTTTSGIDSPTIQQRKISTSVAVKDGDTMALGGLIRQSRSNGNSGIPVLKDIPVVGDLFGTSDETVGKTELLIFIRPQIVTGAASARAATEELQSGLNLLGALINDQQKR